MSFEDMLMERFMKEGKGKDIEGRLFDWWKEVFEEKGGNNWDVEYRWRN